MIYPSFLKKGDCLGITAPSAGVGDKIEDYERSLDQLKNRGFFIKETESVRNSGLVSGDGPQRAKELENLLKDPKVGGILCAAGGDFLMEMLEHVDFKTLSTNPKWIQGYSDPTGLLFPITTGYDIATLYGPNAGSYDMTTLHESLDQNLRMLQGENLIQKSFDKYQSGWGDGCDGYDLDREVNWETPNGSVQIEGRAIGGCLDVLLDLVGTKYDFVTEFLERYKEDGFVWYLDVFGLRAEEVARGLWQLKEAGWFSGLKGMVIGRVRFPESLLGITYEEAVLRILGEIPLVMEADIGHVKPSMTMINGARCSVTADKGKGSISFQLD